MPQSAWQYSLEMCVRATDSSATMYVWFVAFTSEKYLLALLSSAGGPPCAVRDIQPYEYAGSMFLGT